MIRKLLPLIAAAATLAAPAFAEPTAITGATVWTGGPGGAIENGVVIIEDGRLTAVGPAGTPIPGSAVTIDAAGGWVTPGIISAYSRTGLVEVGAEDDTDDRRAGKSAYTIALNAAEGFNPAATPVDVTRIEGITRIVVAPAPTSNLFAGQGFIADTSGAPDTVLQERAFVHIALGEAGADLAGGSRPAAWAQLRAALGDAQTFPARFIAHNEGSALNRVDAQAFGPASRGQQLMLIAAHRASDLRQIIAFKADNPNLQIAIVGAAEGWLVADDLAAANIPVIVDAFNNLPSSFAQLGATAENAERLLSAGVPVAFYHSGDDSHQARLVLQVAGNAVANGMDRDAALAAITATPARIFGLEGYGTLAVGAPADVVVWNGDPLEVTSSPDAVFIDGERQSLESRQTRLRDRYLTLESDRPLAYRR